MKTIARMFVNAAFVVSGFCRVEAAPGGAEAPLEYKSGVDMRTVIAGERPQDKPGTGRQ